MMSRSSTCYQHVAHDPLCQDCVALANSLFLGMVMEIRDGMLTPEQEARAEAWKAKRHMGPLDGLIPQVDEDGLMTFRVAEPHELLDITEAWVRGDVDAA